MESVELLREATHGTSLPVIERPIDNTALQAYLACPREYFLSMMQHRRGDGKSAALGFGSAWHKAMEVHYKSGGDMDLVEMAVHLCWQDHGDPNDYRTRERVMVDYRKYIKDPANNDFKDTVGYEAGEPLVELSANSMGGGLLHPWAGKLDRPIKPAGGLVLIEDHKTTSRFDKNYWTQWGLSNQMKGYTYLMQQLLPSETVIGARINLSHVLTNKTEFHRRIFTFTPAEIKEWVHNTNVWMRRLGRDIELYNDLIAKGWDSWEAITEAFPAHFGDNGCSRKFGMCSYHSVCAMHPKLRERVLDRDFPINPWNPLEED